jgi:pimeloyl-ACP methyl ester carboxylesterase
LIYDALKNLPENKKEIHLLPNTGHCPAIECPDELKRILLDFFEKYS